MADNKKGQSVRPITTPAGKFIAVGIDFGTTYSGVSWVSAEVWDKSHGNTKLITDVMRWPQDGTYRDEEQVPSLIDPENGKWGMGCLSADTNPIRWLKLLLLDESELTDDFGTSKEFGDSRKRLNENKQYGFLGAVGLIARFLEKIWSHTLQMIEEDLGHAINLPLKVAMGVPAMWKPEARERLRRAAILAGITDTRYDAKGIAYATTLRFLEEAEAAATSTLRDRNERMVPEISIGDTFIVCDGGGGTIDAITYMVTSNSPFRAEAVVPGKVSLNGGFRIDRAFEDYLHSAAVQVRFKFSRCSNHDMRIFLEKEWEWNLKRKFTKDVAKFALNPPFTAISRKERWWPSGSVGPQLKLESEVVAGFFSDSLTGIRRLIGEQRNLAIEAQVKAPRNIFFVGGLAGSGYLYSELQEQYYNVHRPNPKHIWSAVARGAVIMILESDLSYPVDQELTRTRLTHSNATELDLRLVWHVKERETTSSKTPAAQEFYLDFGREEDTGVNIRVHVNVAYDAVQDVEPVILSHELP
ncbi:hypothetical protein QBC44DRAFT_383103 [Cladorrhinum sp. PSN332]|nr:hypothetical protein QBC44DRAFT_383103 [Cladorrhinum sp. PSN332]